MTAQEHLQRCISDLRAKERVARDKARTEQVRADTFLEAATVLEVELTRLPQPQL
jgi:hypothetical protein